MENIGKALYRRQSLVSNNINVDSEAEPTALLKGGISNSRYIWHSENGEHTCEACKALDGTTYDIEDQVPERPHPNCRCTVEIVNDTANTEPCDYYKEIEQIYQQTEELENEIKFDLDEIESIITEVESDYQEYMELYDIAQDLKNEVENMEPCSENCIAITGFAIDLSNDKQLGDIYYNLIKEIEPARESYLIFEQNKKLMEEDFKKIHIDKYYHAKANCESAELGIWYAAWATIHSIFKEFKDYIKKVYKDGNDAKEIFKDCMNDLKADIMGLLKAREHGYCSDKVLEVEKKFPRY